MFLDSLPAFKIIALQLGRIQRLLRRSNDGAGFKHERHSIGNVVWLRRIRVRRLFKRFGVGAVTRHTVMQARTAR